MAEPFPPDDPRKKIMCALERFHPIRMDEKDLKDALGPDADLDGAIADLVSADLIGLEETVPPFQSRVKRRYGLTEKGRDLIKTFKGETPECINPREIESRLISTYDTIKVEMEEIRQDLERDQKVIEEEMAKMRKSIGDHDQFLKTYFVRIMESIGVFIGVFGIVVVMMVSNLSQKLYGSDTDIWVHITFVITLPLLLAATILPGMWLVKRLILTPSR